MLKVSGKYNSSLAANFLLKPAAKQFWKSVNICQSYANAKCVKTAVSVSWSRKYIAFALCDFVALTNNHLNPKLKYELGM